MEAQQEIELSYDKRAMSGPCYSETSIVATGFRVLNHKSEVPKEVKESVIQTPVNWSKDPDDTEKSQSLVRTDN